MKTELVTIQVARFTDDDGTPACGECCFCDNTPASCWFSLTAEKPGGICPIWHNTVKPKWATFVEWKKSIAAGDGYNAEDAWGAARK